MSLPLHMGLPENFLEGLMEDAVDVKEGVLALEDTSSAHKEYSTPFLM